jgi:hypothetical protein
MMSDENRLDAFPPSRHVRQARMCILPLQRTQHLMQEKKMKNLQIQAPATSLTTAT